MQVPLQSSRGRMRLWLTWYPQTRSHQALRGLTRMFSRRWSWQHRTLAFYTAFSKANLAAMSTSSASLGPPLRLNSWKVALAPIMRDCVLNHADRHIQGIGTCMRQVLGCLTSAIHPDDESGMWQDPCAFAAISAAACKLKLYSYLLIICPLPVHSCFS